MTGRGGWPMTVFLTPDGRPFFGGTYFPPRRPQGTPGFGRSSTPSTRPGASRRDELLEPGRPRSPSAARDRPTPPPVTATRGRRRWPRPAADADLSSPAVRPRVGRVRAAPRSSPSADARAAARAHGATRRRTRSLAMVDARPSTPWPRAGSTTTSAAASPATRSTRRGSVPHFEKMLYDQAAAGPPLPARLAGHRRRPGCRQVVDGDRRLRAARPRRPGGRLLLAPRTPTPRARRAASTSGRPDQMHEVRRRPRPGRRRHRLVRA